MGTILPLCWLFTRYAWLEDWEPCTWPGSLGTAGKPSPSREQTFSCFRVLAREGVNHIIFYSSPAEKNKALDWRLYSHALCSACSQCFPGWPVSMTCGDPRGGGTDSSPFDSGRGWFWGRHPDIASALCWVQTPKDGLVPRWRGTERDPFLNRAGKQKKARDPLSSSIQLFWKLEYSEMQYLLLPGTQPDLCHTTGESCFSGATYEFFFWNVALGPLSPFSLKTPWVQEPQRVREWTYELKDYRFRFCLITYWKWVENKKGRNQDS